MGLTDNERQVVVRLELETAASTFSDMLKMVEQDMLSAAANRLYYSLFHAMSALLISDGHNIKGHRGLISLFGMHYVKPKVFSNEDGALLSKLVIMRDNADYNCFYKVTKEELDSFILPTKQLIDKIRDYITDK